jgi:hypothetical protein
MIRHVVSSPGTTTSTTITSPAVAAALDGLVDAIPEIRSYRHGRDVGLNEGNHDYVVVGDFDSADDYLVYRDHPVHQAFITELIAGRLASRAAIQYELAD